MDSSANSDGVSGTESVAQSETIRVCCRFRPLPLHAASSQKSFISHPSHQTVRLDPPDYTSDDTILEAGGMLNDSYQFVFDEVFPVSASTVDVYSFLGKDVVAGVLNGYNSCLFVYGQTGSGKTHTMMGSGGIVANDETSSEDNDDYSDRGAPRDKDKYGLTPLIISDIFEGFSRASEDVTFNVKVSFVEVYLERVKDLLSPQFHGAGAPKPSVVNSEGGGGAINPNNLQLRTHPTSGAVYIQGVSEFYVADESDVFYHLQRGNGVRAVGETKMNRDSSRSHSVFIIKVERRQGENVKTGQLYLVDLAGSESVGKTGADGLRLKEAQLINKSLSALGNVINALSEGKKHVPYRDSKLTRMLEDCLGGNAKTTLVCMCSSELRNAVESVSTLRFGTRAKRVVNKAKVNVEKGVEEYKGELVKANKREKELMKFVKALCMELIALRNVVEVAFQDGAIGEELSFEGPLWKSIEMIVADEEGVVAEGAVGGDGGVEEQAREAHAMEEVGETGARQDERRPVVNSAEEDLIMIQRLQSALETTVEELQIRSEELSEAQYDVKELSSALEEQGNEVKRIEDVMDGVKGELEDVRMKYDDCERQRREIEYREKEANLFVNQLREEFKKLRQGIRGEGGGELESMINEAGLGDDEQDEPFDASVEPAVGDSGDSGHGDDEAIIPPPPPPVDSPPGTPPPPPPPQVKRHDAELEDAKKSVEALAIAAAATHEASKRERELVSDLSEMTRRFIDLKMQLEESKGDIELLSGNGGKGELAKEAVRLRKTLDRKSRDVQSVMLKGQELHMLNNTLQSKLANREQHVEYLEASLKDLQDAHRLFIKESRGTNVKLGEENKRLRRALEQMEGGFKGAGSPNKVVVPIRGGGGKARKGSSNAGSPRSERKGKRKDSKGGEEEAAKGVDWSPMKEGATPVMSGELVKEKTEAYFGASDSSSGTEDDDDDAVYARAAAATAKAIQMQKKKHKRLSSKLSGLKTLMPKKGSLVGKILGTLGTGGDDSGDNGSPKSDKGLGEDGNEEPSPPRREKRSESWLFGGSKRGSSSS